MIDSTATRHRAKVHYYLHRDEILARRRKDYATNREKYLVANKRNYRKHHKERIEQARIYRQSHLEETRTRDRAYYAANKQKAQNYQRTHKYGLTPEEFDKMIKEQGGVCVICKVENWNGRKPHVDHNHISGKVRGILCHRCNSAIGLVGEKVAVLEQMIKYLGGNYNV